jgi:hypothetical protein
MLQKLKIKKNANQILKITCNKKKIQKAAYAIASRIKVTL